MVFLKYREPFKKRGKKDRVENSLFFRSELASYVPFILGLKKRRFMSR
jgi:hypothetical protein